MQKQLSISPITLVIPSHLHLTKARRSFTFLFFCGSVQHDPRPYPQNNLLTGEVSISQFVFFKLLKSFDFIHCFMWCFFVKQMSINIFHLPASLTFSSLQCWWLRILTYSTNSGLNKFIKYNILLKDGYIFQLYTVLLTCLLLENTESKK